MIVLISGPSGSGKTTVARSLSAKLNLNYVSAGELFRQVAKSMGKDILDLNLEAEKDFSIDKEIDRKIFERALKGNVVIESHIVGWLLRDLSDVSVYLWAPVEERARRISIRDNLPYKEALEKVIAREDSHGSRFWKYYGVDFSDLSAYDLTLNTFGLTADKVVEIILQYIRSKK